MGFMGEGKGMDTCDTPQEKTAEETPSNSGPQHETEQSFHRSAIGQMQDDLAHLKTLLAKFTRQLEEWQALT